MRVTPYIVIGISKIKLFHRREPMLQSIKHYFLIAFMCSITALSYGRDRPNILFVLAEDQRCDSFGFYGRPEFETPPTSSSWHRMALFLIMPILPFLFVGLVV